MTIQQKTEATDSQGGRSTTWAALETVAAEEMPLRVGEQLQAQALGSHVARRIRIRHRADVTPSMRLLWRGRTLEIHGVTSEDGLRQFLLLDVGEVA